MNITNALEGAVSHAIIGGLIGAGYGAYLGHILGNGLGSRFGKWISPNNKTTIQKCQKVFREILMPLGALAVAASFCVSGAKFGCCVYLIDDALKSFSSA